MLKHLCISLALAASVFAQNYSVTFAKDDPASAAELAKGLPQFWVVPALSHPIGTNTTATPPAVVLNRAQLGQCVATNQAAYDAYLAVKKAEEEAPGKANIQALVDLYAQCLDYELFCRTNTPTQAQAILHVRRMNGVLLRLKPVLQELYEKDPK